MNASYSSSVKPSINNASTEASTGGGGQLLRCQVARQQACPAVAPCWPCAASLTLAMATRQLNSCACQKGQRATPAPCGRTMVERLASVLGSEARSHPDRLSARRSRLLPGLFFGQAFGDGRRSVTDLGGSTGFGERTDPELDRTTTARYHAILQSVIDRLVKVFDTACTGKAAQLVTVARLTRDGQDPVIARAVHSGRVERRGDHVRDSLRPRRPVLRRPMAPSSHPLRRLVRRTAQGMPQAKPSATSPAVNQDLD